MEVTIDGRKIALEQPVTVLEAARRLGIDIPTLCWHPRVSVLGACRLCMIEVEGINRLLAACTTQVSDGMSILTDTPQLRKVRQAMLELLLCRHPLDCPTCVKGGECELQELAYRHSDPQNRFPENPAPYPVTDPSPFVERDPKKCVLCRRCVRVCREVRGVTVLAAMERGYHKRVGTYFQRPLNSNFQNPYNCEFCGACIDICPVGALNSKVRKFRARTWEGSKTPSVCPFCSVGCTLTLQVKEGELVRSIPREGPNNEDQACFRGRFGTDYANATSRLVAPLMKNGAGQRPADRKETLDFIAGKIKAGKKTAALISSSLTREEAAAAAHFVKEFCPGAEVLAVDTLGMAESDRCSSVGGRSWDDLEAARLVFVAGEDFTILEPVAGVRIRLAREKSGAGLVTADPRDTLLGGESDLWLRPPGTGVPLLLGGILHALVGGHRGALRGAVDENFLGRCPGAEAAQVEKSLNLPEGSVAAAAARLAEAQDVVFVGHRGWHDEGELSPLVMNELDRLLAGEKAKGIIYLGRDCNSRGAARYGSLPPVGGAADLLLVFGADPLGSSLPHGLPSRMVREAGAVVVFDSFATSTASAAAAVVPLPVFAEKTGSFEASNGLVQTLERAMEPPPGVLPLGDTLGEIAAALGGSFNSPPPPGDGDTAAEGGTPSLPEASSFPSLPSPGEKYLVLRPLVLADHRLRLVKEAEMLLPGRVVEVHPSDLESLGLAEGEKADLVSGGARLTRTVVPDPRTPPGQVHLPFDPEDEDAAKFAEASARPEGWSGACRLLEAVERKEEEA